MYEKENKTITYLEEDGSVKYIFNKATGKLIVKYQDTEGNELAPDETTSGKVGEGYQHDGKDIDGYTFVKAEGHQEGTFTREDQTITYVYEKVDTPTTPENPATPSETETPTTETQEIPPKNNGHEDEEKTPDNPTTDNGTNTPDNGGNTDTTTTTPNKQENNGNTTVVTNPPHNAGNVSTVSTTATNMNYAANTNSTAQPAVETASTPTLANPAQSSMLPQTGDAGTQTSLMGGMLLALGALAGTLGLRNRKKK